MRASDDQSMELQPGTIVTGRYEIVKRLGRGSMGFVYACRDREHAGRLVAMKVLFHDFAKDKTGAARFRNEILAAFEVHHSNVMSAFEYIRDGGITAYTMEYVGGGDLAERISSGEQLPLHEVLRLWSQMAAGVDAIHKKGIIHRDLKPENILLTTSGDVKIADFGIARTGHGPKLTEHGGVVGTIDYVSPEYMLRGQVDHRSDIYALGILAYEMLTGNSPFQGDSVYATMTKRLKQDPVPPSQVRSDTPETLDKIVLLAMAREPEARYQTALQMQIDIDELRGELGFLDIPAEVSQRGSGNNMPATSGRVVRVDLDAGDEPQQSGLDSGGLRRRGPGVRDSNPLGQYFDEISTEEQAAPVKMEPLLNRGSAKRPNNAEWPRASGNLGGAGNSGAVSSGAGNGSATLQRVYHESRDANSASLNGAGLSGGGLNGSGLRQNILGGGLADHKLRTLGNHGVSRHNSLWHDVFLALIMLFVGVGFGFAVISVVLPNFFSGEESGSAATSSEFEAKEQGVAKQGVAKAAAQPPLKIKRGADF